MLRPRLMGVILCDTVITSLHQARVRSNVRKSITCDPGISSALSVKASLLYFVLPAESF
jgi:hypothetical protein